MRRKSVKRAVEKVRALSWSRRRRRLNFSIAVFYIILAVASAIVTINLNELIIQENIIYKLNKYDADYEMIRKMELDYEICSMLQERYKNDDTGAERFANAMALQQLYRECTGGMEVFSKELSEYYITMLGGSEAYVTLAGYLKSIFVSMKTFPVDLAYDIKGTDIAYEDSWMAQRSYGGSRGHEGTDIMTAMNRGGYYPVLSVSDGVVENMGWLEQGGYRVGIRSDTGVYYYYAHLHSYAEKLEKGMRVSAGDTLGLMGDTGYSKVEGTTGNFDVHLHFGIYVKDELLGDVSVNPYYILRVINSDKH